MEPLLPLFLSSIIIFGVASRLPFSNFPLDDGVVCGSTLLLLPAEKYPVEKWITQLQEILRSQDNFTEKAGELFQQLDSISSQKLEL